MAKTIFPNIRLIHDVDLPDNLSMSRCGHMDNESYFYWYCSLLQEENGTGMMECDDDEFLSGAFDILALAQNRMAHA